MKSQQVAVRCTFLGEAVIQLPGIRLTPEAEGQFGLALFYCASAGRPVPREEVARLFWPDHDEAAARHCLRQALYRLRALGIPVRSGAKATTLDQRAVDADYTPVVAEGASATDFLALSDLTVLPGYDPQFSAPFAAWVEKLRAEIGTHMRRGLVRAIADLRSRGRYTEVERLARQCLTLDPLNEEATLALVEAVILAGGKAEALEMIERYEREVGRSPALRATTQLLRTRVADVLTHASTAVGEAPFVGRTTDVELVLMSLARVAAGFGALHFVVGPPGVGKTRLCEECCRIARLQGIQVVTVGAQPDNRNQPLSTISDVLPKLLTLPGALGAAPSALECLRSLISGTALDGSLPVAITADVESTRGLIRWSLQDLLDAIASEAPLLVFLDDAQYADASTLSLLASVFRALSSRRLGILCAARESWSTSPSAPLSDLQEVCVLHRLPPLADEACLDLIQKSASIGLDDLKEAARDRIIHLSGGNPLVLLELLRHRRDLHGVTQLPASISGLLEQRLRHLPPPALRVLQWCALLGPLATIDRIRRCSRDMDIDLHQALSALQAGGMLKATSHVLQPRHELLADAALALAGDAVLRLLNARAAEVVGREVAKSHSIAHLWQCLRHWTAAGVPERGIAVATRLAGRLLAAGHATDAHSILRDLEPHCVTARDRYRVLRSLARVARVQRDWHSVVECAERALATREGVRIRDSSSHELELLSLEASWYLHGASFDCSERLLHLVRQTSADVVYRLEAAIIALTQADNDGRESFAHEVYREVTSIRPSTRRARIAKITCGMIFEATLGSTEKAVALADDLVRLSESIQRPTTRAVMLRRAAIAYRRAGKHPAAIEAARNALDIAQRLQLSTSALVSLEQLLDSTIDQGDFESSKGLLDEMRTIAGGLSGPLAGLTPATYEVRLAFESTDLSHISERTWHLYESPPEHAIRRIRQTMLVTKAALCVLCRNEPELRTMLSELKELHAVLGHHGSQDYALSVLVHALRMLGDDTTAQALLEEYIGATRRDRGPLSASLDRLYAESPRGALVAGPTRHLLSAPQSYTS